MRILLTLSLLFFSLTNFSQETYGLVTPGANLSPKCADCIAVLRELPPEVNMKLKVDASNQLFFVMTDEAWFDRLFAKSTDGLAVDIIPRSDFNCMVKNSGAFSGVAKGDLQPPVYSKDMGNKKKVSKDGTVLIDLGPLPAKYHDKEYELNLILLSKKNTCHYTAFYNIKRYKWEILEMGLYTDTIISSETPKGSIESGQQTTTNIQYKKLNFVVPFEKNKSNYTKEDLLPLYDSLRLNLYDIKQIKIRAYSSVEGSKANNIKLQESRAKSIVSALQEYQSETIQYDISSAENWVEFYQDIKGTEFESLSDASKESIKKKLENKAFSLKMEPILGRHRKAVIEISIEKKTTFTNLSEEQLVDEFKKSITQKDEETAKELMNLAFQRVIHSESPDNFLDQLEIPEQQEHGLLKNRMAVFQYFLNEDDLMATYENFLALKKIIPLSKEINYNLIALKFKLWKAGLKEIKPEAFQKEIRGLVRYGVSAQLMNRMLINYNIILSDINMTQKNYKAKDRNLKSILTKYKSIGPSSQDILKLAQYFVAYGEFDAATRLIKPYIGKVDTDEDLLFYYINLTVVDPKVVAARPYKKILLNAIDLNEKRFCKLFNSALQDGISFQLLDIPNLKRNYCESCQ